MSVWEEREEELEGQLNRSALWAVTYGDLMSYLTIFFLMLYTAVGSKSVSMQMSVQALEEKFGKQTSVINELFSKNGIQRIARLEIGEDKIRIMFLEPVLFDSGKADLKSTALPDLQKLAKDLLSSIPNPIQIEGHTDNAPLMEGSEFSSNWELSAARAFAVLRFFEKCGVPANRLSAIGYGEFRPVKPNTSPEGRAANRRIEITILRRNS